MSSVLFVCTANQCRSPMAAGLLERHLSRRRDDGGFAGRDRLAGAGGVNATGEVVEIASAGLLGGGAPVVAGAKEVMRVEFGVDLGDHRSRLLGPDLLARADLVLGMERSHVREAVVIGGAPVWPRAFTLAEAVRRARTEGGRGRRESLGSWLDCLHHGRESAGLLGHDEGDDVADPVAGGLPAIRRAARRIDALVAELAVLAWPIGDVRPVRD